MSLAGSPGDEVRDTRRVPTVARLGPYRFFFFSDETLEPPHVHVQSGDALAKFWLDPVALSSSRGFAAHELRRIRSTIEERRVEFEDAWNEFFSA